MESHNKLQLWSSDRLIKPFSLGDLPGKDIGIMRSREGLFELLQLETGERRPVAALLPLLRIFVIQIDVGMVRHGAVPSELRHSAGPVVVGRSAVVRYVLQLSLLGYAHTGLMEGVKSIDVENFLCF